MTGRRSWTTIAAPVLSVLLLSLMIHPIAAQQNLRSSDSPSEAATATSNNLSQDGSSHTQAAPRLPAAPRFYNNSPPAEATQPRLDPFVQPASAIDAPRAIQTGGARSLSSIDSDLRTTSDEKTNGAQSATLVREPIALRPRSDSPGEGKGIGKPSSTPLGSTITMFTSLLIVLALFLGLMLLLKKTKGPQNAELPREVFQVLGTSRLAGRHPLYLLRLGNKLVLVHASSGEVQSITEITDAEEVHRLCGSCEQNQPNSISESFRQVLKQVTDGKISGGALADSRFRRSRSTPEPEEVSPAMALLAKEKS